MDNTTALVALISTSGTVLVAAIGAIGALFGESWRESRRSAAQARAAAVDRRYDALVTFSEALIAATQMERWADRLEVNRARIRFSSTLRSGEGAVADYAAELVDAVAREQIVHMMVSLRVATGGSDQLFAWLRGDMLASELTVPDGH
ncbi:hypothetical protein [Microbacterium sp. Leaf151]|uniref:hypothetical protein n=1 Tax=Microbacterium sp. Leaf151 TaxID=1736276 RepID=UPI000AA618F9|nr:hypothetical protein [Microbacterium sp. Leaf151]